jgi:octaprenyl-diphosphate synthase
MLNSESTGGVEPARYLFNSGGKRFRPILTLAAAGAVDCDRGSAVSIAVAAELVHVASLLHDDVLDGEIHRRGRASPAVVYGRKLCILAGDWCLARTLRMLISDHLPAAAERLARTIEQMANAEATGLAVNDQGPDDGDRVEAITDGKTGALIVFCTTVGGLAPASMIPALSDYGCQVGRAFQITDDALDAGSAIDRINARAQAELVVARAIEALSPLPNNIFREFLAELACFAAARSE